MDCRSAWAALIAPVVPQRWPAERPAYPGKALVHIAKPRGKGQSSARYRQLSECRRKLRQSDLLIHRPLFPDSQSDFGLVLHHCRNASTLSNAIGKAFKANRTESADTTKFSGCIASFRCRRIWSNNDSK
jgi:hypothetical protein